MRTATYNAPTGELVPVIVILGRGTTRHPFLVRVSTTVSQGFQEGQQFSCAAMRISTVIDDGKTLDWFEDKGRANSARYVTYVDGWGEVTVKQATSRSGRSWRAYWPDGKWGCTKALAHETIREAEDFIANRRKRLGGA